MTIKDLIVIGGGINGAGIAADAAGRGLSVMLLEARDLAGATSSASSKLIHGGLRYLEQYEFRLVSEALAEREVLLKMAPHIIFPLRFIMPHQPHLRPAWMIRVGLFLYDKLSRRNSLPASQSINFSPDNNPFKAEIKKGFAYSDCWADDSRLVLLNAQLAAEKGAEIFTRTAVLQARRQAGIWHIDTRNSRTGKEQTFQAKGLVNATGPWAKVFEQDSLAYNSASNLRLIKGSHIITKRLQQTTQAYILQNIDGRVVFVIPWLKDFSIIGTTDVEYQGNPDDVKISQEEIDYLLDAYNRNFKQQLATTDILHTYSGVRSLYDDASGSPQNITRDYVLQVSDTAGQAPLLSIYGGKLTTYRKLAEHALEKLRPYYPYLGLSWTKNSILPGGDIGCADANAYSILLQRNFPWLPQSCAWRYAHAYGTKTRSLLQSAQCIEDLGEHFGHDLYEIELRYLVENEWAMELEDVIWRRTKLVMYLNDSQTHRVDEWLHTYIKQYYADTSVEA